MQEDLAIIVKTTPVSHPPKFKGLYEKVNLEGRKRTHKIKVEIENDEENYVPESVFFLDICSEAGTRLKGDDTRAKVIIHAKD